RSWPDIGPALLLPLHDLDDTGADVRDAGQHVRLRELLAAHRILAGRHLDPAAERVANPVADGRIGFQHADAGTVRDDLDLHVRSTQVRLQVAGVVEREVPLPGIGVADLHDDAIL